MAVITQEQLENASRDANDLGLIVNGAADLNGTGKVATRTGGNVRTIRRLLTDLEKNSRFLAKSWSDLVAVTDRLPGAVAEVPTSDAGTHTDPATGATVSNSGIFSWSNAPAGWSRISDFLAPSMEVVNEAIAAAIAPLAKASTLSQLKKSLVNPLCQYLGIVLIGDSITWGMTVTGGLPIEPYPRTGTLADARNNATSPTWANLTHQHLGLEYYEDATVTATSWPTSQAGVAIFEYSKSLDLFPVGGDFNATNSVDGAGSWATYYSDPATRLGYFLQATVDSANDDLVLSFPFTGYQFDLIYASLDDGARYKLYVNGQQVGDPYYSTQNGDTGQTTAFGRSRTHTMGGFVKDALVEIKVVPGDNARRIFRVEAIHVDRMLRVTNQGIVGMDAYRYTKEGLINDAIRTGDTFGLFQLGTNDRALDKGKCYATSPTGLAQAMDELLNKAEAKGVTPILLCANAVITNTKPPFFYDMSDVRAALRALAMRRNISFIDQFAITRHMLAAGDTSFLADGLHPGNTGHPLMFANIRSALDLA